MPKDSLEHKGSLPFLSLRDTQGSLRNEGQGDVTWGTSPHGTTAGPGGTSQLPLQPGEPGPPGELHPQHRYPGQDQDTSAPPSGLPDPAGRGDRSHLDPTGSKSRHTRTLALCPGAALWRSAVGPSSVITGQVKVEVDGRWSVWMAL